MHRRSTSVRHSAGIPNLIRGFSEGGMPLYLCDGDGAWETGIFRKNSGFWVIRGVTRSYFGSIIDEPIPGDYDGNSQDDMGIFLE